MAGTFDFCPNSRVIEELAPDEPGVTDMNGWTFAPKAKTPYRPQFKVTLHGLYWKMGSGVLDVTTTPLVNAGRLRAFYIQNRLSGVFGLQHEYLGLINCRFVRPVSIPAAEVNSNGLIPAFEVNLEWHNPPWS